MTQKEKELLEKSIKEAEAIDRVYRSNDFQIHLLPYLQELIKVRWIDPTKFKDRDEFFLAYEHLRAKVTTIEGLLKFMSEQGKYAIEQSKKLTGEQRNYEIK